MERYDGVAILSANLLGSFDDAFMRRLQYYRSLSASGRGPAAMAAGEERVDPAMVIRALGLELEKSGKALLRALAPPRPEPVTESLKNDLKIRKNRRFAAESFWGLLKLWEIVI